MTPINVWLIVALCLVSMFSIFLCWYLRKLLRKFLFISENLLDLVVMVENYQNHLKQLNNMEVYSGDETIMYLLRHTDSLVEMLEDYKDVYDYSEPLEIAKETPEDDNSETTPKEEAEEDPISITEKNVFYAGTRRRDN